MLPLNPVQEQRRMFARAKAREIHEELRAYEERGEGEYFLAEKLADALAEYERGLEALCNHYHKQACDALNLKMPEPFVVKV